MCNSPIIYFLCVAVVVAYVYVFRRKNDRIPDVTHDLMSKMDLADSIN